MKLELDLRHGSFHNPVGCREDFDDNLKALQRAIDGKPLAVDFVLLMDTKTIIEQIQKQFPKRKARGDA
jgi:hypothetical protein